MKKGVDPFNYTQFKFKQFICADAIASDKCSVESSTCVHLYYSQIDRYFNLYLKSCTMAIIMFSNFNLIANFFTN